MGRPVATHQPTRRPSTSSRRTSALGYARGAVALLFGAMTTQSPLRPDAGAAPSAPGPGSLTVIYDADCGVCRETVRRLRRWDHEDRFVFVPLQAAAGCGRPRIEALAAEGHLAESVHVIDEATGRVVSGGHAALVILDALPGGWLLRPWAALPPTAAAADVVYRMAARNRDRLAWLTGMRNEVSCPIAKTPASTTEH